MKSPTATVRGGDHTPIYGARSRELLRRGRASPQQPCPALERGRSRRAGWVSARLRGAGSTSATPGRDGAVGQAKTLDVGLPSRAEPMQAQRFSSEADYVV